MTAYINMVAHEIPTVEAKDVINKQFDATHVCRYDTRTGTVHLVDTTNPLPIHNYLEYMKILNKVAFTEGKKLTNGQKMLLAGFIPLVTEPSFGTGLIYDHVRDKLQESGLPFKEIYPQTFMPYDRGFLKDARDIWIHRMDGMKFIGAPNVYQVTTYAIWEALGL